MSQILWNSCLESLTAVINKNDLEMWITPLSAKTEGSTLVLFAPNKYLAKEVEKRFLSTIELIVKKFEPDFNVQVKEGVIHDLFDAPTASEKTGRKKQKTYSSNLNSAYTFDNFVKGNSNQIAANSAMGVANQPKGQFNPLLIYGSTGLGKSHLLHAIGNHIKQTNHTKKLIYQTGEQFVSEMLSAISNGKIEQFKQFYRSIDILLVDDIQFIAGKNKSQEEFFHLFNTLADSNSQVVLTSDKYPKDIEGLEPRLKSRFGAGLPVAIEPPELETRVAILKKKADLLAFDIDDKVAFFIAEKVRSHVRDLEGALNKVFAMSQFNNQPASIELCKVALRDILSSQQRQVSIENIQKTVANFYHIKVSDLKSKTRKSAIAKPRQMAMAVAKQLTNLSLPDIGEAFERDHTTVIHAIKKIDEMKKADPKIREDMTNLIMILTS